MPDPVSTAEPSLPVDPSLPQLGVARDPELMREVFQRHLRPLGKKAHRIRECRISRVRYQRVARCMLQYTLILEDLGTGRERTQWVTGVVYAKAGRALGEWEELRRSKLGRTDLPGAPSSSFAPFRWIREKLRSSWQRGREISGATFPAFEPYAYVPELEMLVQVFPYDHRLPGLPLLMGEQPPELEPLLLARFGEGEWRIEAWDIEPVKYLAELRATLRLTVLAREEGSGREEERRFYAKVYREKEDGERTYRVLRALWEREEARGESFAVGRPITYLREPRALIQEEVLGTSLHDVLVQEDVVDPVMRRAARALAALHLDGVKASRHLSWREKEITALERIGELLRPACPHLREEIEEIVGTVVAGLEEVPTAPIHGDLHPRHIVLDGDRLVLLDLDNFAEADPVLDVAHLLAPLAIMPLRFPITQDRAREAAWVFVEEYFARVPEAWRARFTLHYAAAALRIAGGVFRRQESGWPDRVETLIAEAKGSLAGKIW